MNHIKAGFINILYLTVALMIVWSIIRLFNYAIPADNNDKKYLEAFSANYSVFALDLPAELDYCGEPVPLQYADIRESIDREMLVNTYWQSQTLLFIKRMNKYFPVIEPILKANGIPDDFKYLAVAESGLTNAVSPSGATGFWQFLKQTGIEYGLEITSEVDERYHLEKSTRAACKYMKAGYEKYGNWTMVAASYNSGMAGIDKQIERQSREDYYDLLLNSETARYVFRILAIKTILQDPAKYGFRYREKDLYFEMPYYETEIDSSITDLSGFAECFQTNYKILKLLNPWLRDNTLTNKDGKIYSIKIPEENSRTFIPFINLQNAPEDTGIIKTNKTKVSE